MEQVVDDEVATHGTCGVDDFEIARKEVADIADLQDKDSEPVLECVSMERRMRGKRYVRGDD
jgi:hypothetical protein